MGRSAKLIVAGKEVTAVSVRCVFPRLLTDTKKISFVSLWGWLRKTISRYEALLKGYIKPRVTTVPRDHINRWTVSGSGYQQMSFIFWSIWRSILGFLQQKEIQTIHKLTIIPHAHTEKKENSALSACVSGSDYEVLAGETGPYIDLPDPIVFIL